MVEYEYCTEETEIMEYTEGLRNVLKNPEKYKAIFDCFKKQNLPLLAEIMASMVSGLNELNTRVKEKNNTIAVLNTRVKELESKINTLSTELGELRKQGGGADMQTSNDIKSLYEKYGSLRKVGEILHMDKSTVKRKLIKLGFTFD